MYVSEISDFKIKYSLLWRKIDILCHGLREDDEGLLQYYYKSQNPHETKRTGNAGLQVKLGTSKLALNIAVFKEFCKDSPYLLCKDDRDNLCIKDIRDNNMIMIECPSVAPFWYNKKTYYRDHERLIGDFVLLEGDFTAIASITEGCIYFNCGKQCAFCAIGKDIDLDEDILVRKSMLMSALPVVAEDLSVLNFHLTGGNTFADDRGALDYLEYVEAIKKYRNDACIAVEIPPPKLAVQEEVFLKLKNVGVDSITINIEFWNDDIRKELMPIKGNISKDEYVSAYRTALRYFGKNKVTCGFIVGVESLEDTKEGIKFLASEGVITEVYPFKPNTGSSMEKHKLTDVNDIIEISLFANNEMKINDILPDLCSGCVKCGACGLTQQLISL